MFSITYPSHDERQRYAQEALRLRGAAVAGLLRKISFAGKAGGAAHVAGNPTVLAFLDGTRILAQLTENGAASISLTETVTFPAMDLLSFGALA